MNNRPKLEIKSGFTLIEALVAVSIISIIGLIIVNLLSQTFDSNTKTQLLSAIKQNGQTALNYLDSSIRQADSVVCVGDTKGSGLSNFQSMPGNYTGNVIVLKSNVNHHVEYKRFMITPTTTGINGQVQVDNPTSLDESTDFTLCNVTSLNGPNLQTIIQGNIAPAIVIASASPTGSNPGWFFSLNRSAGAPDTVQIVFLLSSVTSTGLANTQVGNQVFQTTISLK